MRATIIRLWAMLLPLLAALTGCSSDPVSHDAATHTQPAHLYIVVDVSASTATLTNDTVMRAAQGHVGDAVRQLELGDSITVLESGGRSAERTVALPPIATDYNLRIPAASAMATRQMQGIAARFREDGGDNATNLLLTLDTLRPDCTPRSTVLVVSDGVEDSSAYSASKALAANRPVHMPPPTGRYLAGCRVVFVGFGITSEGSPDHPQLLPARQLDALRQGWTAYLQAAGVQGKDMAFLSRL